MQTRVTSIIQELQRIYFDQKYNGLIWWEQAVMSAPIFMQTNTPFIQQTICY